MNITEAARFYREQLTGAIDTLQRAHDDAVKTNTLVIIQQGVAGHALTALRGMRDALDQACARGAPQSGAESREPGAMRAALVAELKRQANEPTGNAPYLWDWDDDDVGIDGYVNMDALAQAAVGALIPTDTEQQR